MNNTICILDYGVGNLHSAVKAFRRFSDQVVVCEDAEALPSASAVVIPGVGAFAAGMDGLKRRGLVDGVKAFAASGKPLLGICLGAQLLLSAGHEFGTWDGLGIIPGSVVPFPKLAAGVKIPHMGWNAISAPQDNEQLWRHSILSSLPRGSEVYFVHSFLFAPERREDVLAVSSYGGYEFPAVLRKGNIYGCQFHPEKSGEAGLAIIKQFVRAAESA